MFARRQKLISCIQITVGEILSWLYFSSCLVSMNKFSCFKWNLATCIDLKQHKIRPLSVVFSCPKINAKLPKSTKSMNLAISFVNNNKLADDDVIQDFLWMDSCAIISDKVGNKSTLNRLYRFIPENLNNNGVLISCFLVTFRLVSSSNGLHLL